MLKVDKWIYIMGKIIDINQLNKEKSFVASTKKIKKLLKFCLRFRVLQVQVIGMKKSVLGEAAP